MDKTKILFLAAEPSDTVRLRLTQELRDIREKLQMARQRDRFLLEARESVRPGDITQAIFDVEPQIVHFSGHGTKKGELCFENILGKTQPVEPDALANLFELVSEQVSCILLNACYSEAQAKAIAQHISFVIGMSQDIEDKAAIAFSVGFYKALGAGRSFEEAYRFACVEIQVEGISGHLIPVLYTNGQVTSYRSKNNSISKKFNLYSTLSGFLRNRNKDSLNRDVISQPILQVTSQPQSIISKSNAWCNNCQKNLGKGFCEWCRRARDKRVENTLQNSSLIETGASSSLSLKHSYRGSSSQRIVLGLWILGTFLAYGLLGSAYIAILPFVANPTWASPMKYIILASAISPFVYFLIIIGFTLIIFALTIERQFCLGFAFYLLGFLAEILKCFTYSQLLAKPLRLKTLWEMVNVIDDSKFWRKGAYIITTIAALLGFKVGSLLQMKIQFVDWFSVTKFIKEATKVIFQALHFS